MRPPGLVTSLASRSLWPAILSLALQIGEHVHAVALRRPFFLFLAGAVCRPTEMAGLAPGTERGATRLDRILRRGRKCRRSRAAAGPRWQGGRCSPGAV